MDELLNQLDLQSVLHSIAEGVTIANADGTIVFSNRAADEILGVTATDAPPEEWAQHYGVFLPDGQTPFPADQYPLVRALKGEHTKDVEMVIRNVNRPAGATIMVTGSPVPNAAGKVVGAIVIFRDVSELRNAQRVKDEFYAFFMHDLKSPLTAVLGLSDLLLAAPARDQDQRSDLEDLRGSAATIQRMVMDFLDVHLAAEGAFRVAAESIAVGDLLRQAAAHMASHARIEGQEIVLSDPPSDLAVRVDEHIGLRVLQNLIDNCIKYAPRGGKIWLASTTGPSGTVRITVRDQGPGIPDALKQRIFDKYATSERDSNPRSKTSRGLGLRFCAVAVAAHGGRIWVEDGESEGAIFVVELPRA